MFRSIFKRSGTADKSERGERGFSAAPASASKAAGSQPATPQVDVMVDEAMLAMSRELSGLAGMEVSRAAKERGWAAVRRELERRPVRALGPAASKGAGARGAAGAGSQGRAIRFGSPRRIMISAAAVAAVALVVSLAAVYGGGGDGPTVVSNPPTTGTSVTTPDTTVPDTTLPDTTVPTDETTVPTDETTIPTGGGTPTSSTPTTIDGSTPTSGTTVTTDSVTPTTKTPTTTQPLQTTTTNEQQMAAAQREMKAKSVAQALGSEVLLAFQSGRPLGDVSAFVTDGARADVTQMVSKLVNPDGCHVSTRSVSGNTVSVLMTFEDVIPDGQGGQQEVAKRFIATVRVGDDRAVITAISYAGS